VEANFSMLAKTAENLGAPRLASDLEFRMLLGAGTDENLKDKVLRTAKRFGKARFAQVAARYIDDAEFVPEYIRKAIEWLRAD
jgi:putative ATP-dependent endonuclease of OLD family